jgi:hypothetical protein
MHNNCGKYQKLSQMVPQLRNFVCVIKDPETCGVYVIGMSYMLCFNSSFYSVNLYMTLSY